MNNKPTIAVLGGDMRQYAVAKEMSHKEADVCAYGLCSEVRKDEKIRVCNDVKQAVCTASAVILPLPASTDERLLNCPAIKSSDRVQLSEIVDAMDKESCLLGGKIPTYIVEIAQKKGIKVFDYFDLETLQIKNAYITAEAALSIAMNSLDKCIKGARLAITGTGRISRLLAELLCKIGARVTVAGRNPDALAYFSLMGCDTLVIKGGDWNKPLLCGYDVIFNTVPSWLFDRNFLELADKKMLIIELASAPGGVDICSARQLSANVLWGASLPGKYAPYSAGELIAEAVSEYLFEEGVL